MAFEAWNFAAGSFVVSNPGLNPSLIHRFHYGVNMKFHFLGALICTIACLSSTATAQNSGGFENLGDTANWVSARTTAGDTFVPLSYGALEAEIDGEVMTLDDAPNGSQIGAIPTGNQQLPWGTVSQDNNVPSQTVFNKSASGIVNSAALEGQPVVHNINSPRCLTGFCFRYVTSRARVLIYVEGNAAPAYDFTSAAGQETANAPETHICWTNPGNEIVTRIEIARGGANESGGLTALNVLDGGEFSFADCAPNGPSCFDQLADVKVSVDGFLATTTDEDDAYWAEGALDCICWMQQDVFWEQPSGDRLSRYGGSMFIGAAYAVAYLECVDDPAADALIEEIMIVLECIVDREIEYAIANGGRSCFIDRAEDLADLGEVIDDDFENEVIATLVYRLAWLNAYYATK